MKTPLSQMILLLVFLSVTPAGATEPEPQTPGTWQRANLSGEWSGLRPKLGDRGISFEATILSDVSSNVMGGLRRGTVLLDRVDFVAGFETEKLLGWRAAASL
jgi:carbohydrate-selective porin OprB